MSDKPTMKKNGLLLPTIVDFMRSTMRGVYLDTDIQVFRNLKPFLDNNFFAGTEVRSSLNADDFITMDASTFGCIKGHWFTKKCLEFYNDKPFRLEDGSIPGGVVQVVATRILEPYGYKRINCDQTIKDIKIYSTEYFANITTINKGKNLYALHHFDGSWIADKNRGFLYKFCRKYDLMHYYRLLEKILKH